MYWVLITKYEKKTFAFGIGEEKVVVYQKFNNTIDILYLLDIRKAFNSVPLDILVNKLQDIMAGHSPRALFQR